MSTKTRDAHEKYMKDMYSTAKDMYSTAMGRLHKLDNKELEAAVKKMKGSIMSGRNLPLPNADLSLQLCAEANKLLQSRQSGETHKQEDEGTLVECLMRDIPNLTEEEARAYLKTHGDPYLKVQKKLKGEIDDEGNVIKVAQPHDESPAQKLSRITGVDVKACEKFIAANGMPNLGGE